VHSATATEALVRVAMKNFTERDILRFGVSSDVVRQLQSVLARDTEVYPQGLVTGYYGVLTLRAVERFQRKYGIVRSGTPQTTGYGAVGPKTRAKLNTLLQ
jgi:peptidoglycan hydrolase-like protein with peptidoglycan-binding domain